jgi:signal transduction histidine kinase/putative methionine-R-sulfoxide reductase with GAF domain
MVLSRHQEMLKELYKLKPDDCLEAIAKMLREILACETVCILLWNEGKQKLITEYSSGMPKELGRPEEYGLNEGLTGRVIFSEGRSVNCLINMAAQEIFDQSTRGHLQDSTTRWENMQAYAQSSIHGFRSLLGAPLFVRDQKIGAVKLINKLNGQEGLKEEGFDADDLETLSYFLDAIEYVVGIKRHEKQVQSLLGIGQKIISAGFNYDDFLDDTAVRCADAMNYRICIIRILEDKELKLRASSVKLPTPKASVSKNIPSSKAITHKVPLKFIHESESKLTELSLESVESGKKIKLSKVNPEYLEFLRKHSIRSFLVMPLHDGSSVIGTIECYTSLPRDFSLTELNTLRMYIDALIISTLKAREQSLLRNLIEIQRIDTITESKGKESRVIRGVLDHTRALLGRRLKVLSAIFFEDSVAKSGLDCDRLYGSREKVLKSVLGKKRFDRLFGEPSDYRSNTPKSFSVQKHGESKDRQTLDIITVGILPEPEEPPLGLILLGLQNVEGSDNFPSQVAQVSADSLAVTLANIREMKRSKILINMLDIVSKKETLSEIYEFILKKTTDFFGFDFGSITTVDYNNEEIRTVKCHSIKPELVDPNQWKDLSTYHWNDNDILVDVFHKKKPEVIHALTPGETRDPRLNEYIYTTFNHQDLARIWIPFVFRKESSTNLAGDEPGHDDESVLGIIEAGFHRQTQARIRARKQDEFVRFIDGCANALQRSALLEERRPVDDIVKRFNERTSEEHPDEILKKLLEDSVKLVKGDSGDITFLTHRDEKVRFLRDSIFYNIPDDQMDKLVRELEVSTSGRCGLVAYVAATGEPYWSNNVKNNPMYIEEFPEVESELVVPLRFSGQTFGFLNINSHKKDWFDERKASLVQTVADQGAVLYQNARIIWPLYKVVSPFNPFASPDQIYDRVIQIIEGFLETETVSVWRKHAERDTFKLQVVAASKELRKKYDEAGITYLKPDSFTGLAASGKKKEVQVSQGEMEQKPQFVHKEFARENGLRSMTAVPIQVGDEIYGAIDVFSRRDTKLFGDEVVILKIIASKAAIALQSAMLIESFSNIAKTAPDDDIRSILERIAQNALEMLHAEPVILFRYDASAEKGKQFDVKAILAGNLYHKNLRIVTNENHLANVILESDKPLYCKKESDFREFEEKSGRVWRSDRFDDDFWRRERIESLAALKLEHRGEVMGVMFINYRTPQEFSDASKRLMEGFASQAALAMYNARIIAENNQFLETKRKDSLSLSVSEVVYSVAHNQGNMVDRVSFRSKEIEKLLNQNPSDLHQKIEFQMQKMKVPLDKLVESFSNLKDYRTIDELKIEPHDINRLTARSMEMIRYSLEKRRIKIDMRPEANLPTVNCDQNQIQHVLVNLFLNARDAMPHGGKLTVSTSFNVYKNQVEIRVSDTGVGVPFENREKIFEPHFTTKKKIDGGSGFGLPISRYMMHKHGGSIELGGSKEGGGGGATFTVVLPVSD